jgi:hypothetical protein
MTNKVNCPHCGEKVDVTEEMERRIEKELRSKLSASMRAEYDEKMELRIAESNESKDGDIARLEQSLKDVRKERNELKDTKRELDALKADQEQLTKDAVANAERGMKRKMNQEMEEKISARIKEDTADNVLKLKEYEIAAERQAAKIRELEAAASRSHGELQGEALEEAAEDHLRSRFPLDSIQAVEKGKYGADIEHEVRNNHGGFAGRILWECKYHKNWNDAWVDKVRKDAMHYGADVMVIVATTTPEDIGSFGRINDVFVCRFHELDVVAELLRHAILKTSAVSIREKHMETIQEKVLAYISGDEFKFVMENILTAYRQFDDSIRTEEQYMQKVWKKRRKILRDVIDNMANMIGTLDALGAGDSVKHLGFDEPNLLGSGTAEEDDSTGVEL